MIRLSTTLIIISLFANLTFSKHVLEHKTSDSDSIIIPFYFALNAHSPTSIHIKNNIDSVVFNHNGIWKKWGSEYQNLLTRKGLYKIFIKVIQDSLNYKLIEQNFEIIGNETMVDISIVLDKGRTPSNELIVTKYYNNDLNIKLKRIWNPQNQFEKDTSFLPDYEILNTSDSILYGIYHRRSSSMLVGWVQLHYITFLRYQKLENGNWQTISCNAPRIQMELKPGETGLTLKDMILDCKITNFQKKGKYRIVLEYGINNTVVRIPEIDDNKSFTYIEPHIYRIYDEFTIK